MPPTTRQQEDLARGPPPDVSDPERFNAYFRTLTTQLQAQTTQLQEQATQLQETRQQLHDTQQQLQEARAAQPKSSESTPEASVPPVASRPSPVPVSALKDLPSCSADLLFTEHLAPWAFSARTHLRAAFAAGAPLDELRACLTAAVPREAKAYFNNAARWTQKDADAGFGLLMDGFIADYGDDTTADDMVDVLRRLDRLKFSSERDHDANVRIALEIVARRQLPSDYLTERLRAAFELPSETNHQVYSVFAATDLASPASLKRFLAELVPRGYYRCQQCRRHGHTVSSCYGRRGGWKKNNYNAKNKSGRNFNNSSSNSSSGPRGNPNSRFSQQRRVEPAQEHNTPAESPAPEPPTYMWYDGSGNGSDRG
jgi:hypothetical protein